MKGSVRRNTGLLNSFRYNTIQIYTSDREIIFLLLACYRVGLAPDSECSAQHGLLGTYLSDREIIPLLQCDCKDNALVNYMYYVE